MGLYGWGIILTASFTPTMTRTAISSSDGMRESNVKKKVRVSCVRTSDGASGLLATPPLHLGDSKSLEDAAASPITAALLMSDDVGCDQPSFSSLTSSVVTLVDQNAHAAQCGTSGNTDRDGVRDLRRWVYPDTSGLRGRPNRRKSADHIPQTQRQAGRTFLGVKWWSTLRVPSLQNLVLLNQTEIAVNVGVSVSSKG